MLKRRKDDGFTLIELMIVIAVIGILAVVLVPKVGGIKSAAKSAGVQTNVRTVQAFLQGRISAWAADSTITSAEIQTEINDAFSDSADTTKQLVNPFDNSVGQGAALAYTYTAPGTSPHKGILYINIPPDVSGSNQTGLNTSGIVIKGYDDNNILVSNATVMP